MGTVALLLWGPGGRKHDLGESPGTSGVCVGVLPGEACRLVGTGTPGSEAWEGRARSGLRRWPLAAAWRRAGAGEAGGREVGRRPLRSEVHRGARGRVSDGLGEQSSRGMGVRVTGAAGTLNRCCSGTPGHGARQKPTGRRLGHGRCRGRARAAGTQPPGRWASRGTFCSRSDRVGSLITPWLMCRGPGHAPALLGVHGRGLAWARRGASARTSVLGFPAGGGGRSLAG